MKVNKIDVEIAESLASMPTREDTLNRLNYFKDEGAISLDLYLKWLHLINGGPYNIIPKDKRKMSDGEKVGAWIIFAGLIAVQLLLRL